MIDRLERELMLYGRHQLIPLRDPDRLDRSAYVLLCLLESSGPMSIRELTEVLGLDTSTVHRQTAALLRDGRLERIADETGGLARKLRMTTAGVRDLAVERELRLAKTGGAVADWPAEDVAELVRLLTRLNLTFEDLCDRRWPRPDVPSTGAETPAGVDPGVTDVADEALA